MAGIGARWDLRGIDLRPKHCKGVEERARKRVIRQTNACVWKCARARSAGGGGASPDRLPARVAGGWGALPVQRHGRHGGAVPRAGARQKPPKTPGAGADPLRAVQEVPARACRLEKSPHDFFLARTRKIFVNVLCVRTPMHVLWLLVRVRPRVQAITVPSAPAAIFQVPRIHCAQPLLLPLFGRALSCLLASNSGCLAYFAVTYW